MSNTIDIFNEIKKPRQIMATIGPTFETEDLITEAMNHHCTWFRLPFGYRQRDHVFHAKLIDRIRKTVDKECYILADLPSERPRLSTNIIKEIRQGDYITFVDSNLKNNDDGIKVDNIEFCLPSLKPGNQILMLDGRLNMLIKEVSAYTLLAEVVSACTDNIKIKEGNSLVFPDNDIQYPPVIENDLNILQQMESTECCPADWVALSLINTVEDVINAQEKLCVLKNPPKIMAKIETRFAVENIVAIANRADGILIGRGDLGLNIPYSQLPYAEKELIKHSREADKIVFIGTQILENFAEYGIPQRCELIDLATASWLGADGIMLGKETVYSKFPLESIKLADSVMNVTNPVSMNWLNFAKQAEHKDVRNFIIAIEGPDGAGKTTLCNNLEKHTGDVIPRSIPKEWEAAEIKTKMIKTKSWVSSAFFFLSGVAEQSNDLKNLNKTVIMDRSVWSTIAIHIKTDPSRAEKIFEILDLIASDISFPDITIVLKPGYDVTRQRIQYKTGNEKIWDDFAPSDEQSYNREIYFFEWLQSLGVPVLFVDASGSEDEVFNIVKEEIEKHG